MFRLKLKSESAAKLQEQWKPVSLRNELLGQFLLSQIERRFQTQGASGGTPWARKKFDDGRSILAGRTAALRRGFAAVATAKGVSITNDQPYFDAQNYGATIVPRKAKALFIPLSDRAASSQRLSGPPAGAARSAYGMRMSQAPFRTATRGPKLKANALFYKPLIQSRIKNGVMEKLTDKGWLPGRGDYMFLMKAVIPKREMLPTSPQEQADAKAFIEETWHPQAK